MNQEDRKQFDYWSAVEDKFEKKKNLNPSQRGHLSHARKMIKELKEKPNL